MGQTMFLRVPQDSVRVRQTICDAVAFCLGPFGLKTQTFKTKRRASRRYPQLRASNSSSSRRRRRRRRRHLYVLCSAKEIMQLEGDRWPVLVSPLLCSVWQCLPLPILFARAFVANGVKACVKSAVHADVVRT